MTLSQVTGHVPSRLPSRPALARLFVIAHLAVLPLVASGCALPGCPAEPEGSPIRVSQQAAQRLQARVEQIAAAARPDFSLEMTDEEATSYLSLNLGTTAITDAEVRFLDGQLQLFARVAQIMNLQVATTWTAQVASGQVRVKLLSASVACVPLPTQLLDPLSETLNQMIVESQMSIQVKEIRVEPGKAVVGGSKIR